jgi:hypothetical protein
MYMHIKAQWCLHVHANKGAMMPASLFPMLNLCNVTLTVQGGLKPWPGSEWNGHGDWDVFCTSVVFPMLSMMGCSKQVASRTYITQSSPTYTSSSHPVYYSGKSYVSLDGCISNASVVPTPHLTEITKRKTAKRKCLSCTDAVLDWE